MLRRAASLPPCVRLGCLVLWTGGKPPLLGLYRARTFLLGTDGRTPGVPLLAGGECDLRSMKSWGPS